eukprot:TRINITY_DN24848_c0_g1_i1.p2 TRINITY_DN24848_c0_g1~~TRINITY_DN24848_c0_g1_i1.p2  ORF type:complete len:105 (-),score=16.93 TRINITY_DN24848_c0_g1_i1:131-445(-)
MGRRFWKRPDLHGERVCGLFIWMDEVAPEYTADQNMGSEQTESRMEEMKISLEEMKREIKHEIQMLRESVEAQNVQKQHPNYCTCILMMLLLFVAYVWGGKFAV